MPHIKIPTPLRGFTDGQAMVNVEGETIGDALNHLIEQFPDLEQHLFQNGELRNFVRIYKGQDDINQLDGLNTPIDENVNLRIIPTIAGG
jgi:sulfur-carrier protein